MADTAEPAAPPKGWHTQQSSTSGDWYYVNSEDLTISTYDRPTAPTAQWLASQSASSGDAATTVANGRLPAGWSLQKSNSTGETYYLNDVTLESTYDMPSAPARTAAEISADRLSAARGENAGGAKAGGKTSGSPKKTGLAMLFGGKSKTEASPDPIAAPRETVENLRPKDELPDGLMPGDAVTSKIQLALRDGKTLKVGAVGHVNGIGQTGKPDMVHVHYGKTGDDVDMFPYQLERGEKAASAAPVTAGEGGQPHRQGATVRMAAVEKDLREKEKEKLAAGRPTGPAMRFRSPERRQRSRSLSPLRLSPSPSRGGGDSSDEERDRSYRSP